MTHASRKHSIAHTRKNKKQIEDDTDLETVERVWTRLLTRYPHPFAVAQARGTLDKFKQTKKDNVEPTKEPWTTQLSFGSWTVSCAELQQFIDTAQMSPAILELFSKLVQTILGAATDKPKIAHAFSMTQPEKNRERLQKMIKSAGRLIVPMFRKRNNAWSVCTVTAKKDRHENRDTLHRERHVRVHGR